MVTVQRSLLTIQKNALGRDRRTSRSLAASVPTYASGNRLELWSAASGYTRLNASLQSCELGTVDLLVTESVGFVAAQHVVDGKLVVEHTAQRR